MSILNTFTRVLGLATIAAVSLPLSVHAQPAGAQPVGILGGVPGDAENSNRLLKKADRVLLSETSGAFIYSLPLNGARNYNFYYDASESNGFLASGPYELEYADKNDASLTASSCRVGRDDAGYGGAASNTAYTTNPGYTSNADVFYQVNPICMSLMAARQDLANAVPGYRGALGIQGRIVSGPTISGQAPSPVVLADVDLIRRDTKTNSLELVASVESNGNGIFSFYYVPGQGDRYEFVPATSTFSRYRIEASSGPCVVGGRGDFTYSPDAFRQETSSSPINNRDYYVVGARAGDQGAGQGDITLGTICRVAGAEQLMDSPAAQRVHREYAEALARARAELKARIARGEYAPVSIQESREQIAARLGTSDAAVYGTAPDLEVFPNPASDRLFVRMSADGSQGEGTITLRDIMGREVLTLRNASTSVRNEIALDQVAPGLYILEVRSGSRTVQKKITVAR